MMTHGPVDVVVLAFGEARFDGSALAELERQSAAGTIRVLDLIILLKDEDENCFRIQVSDLTPEEAAAVAFIEAATIGLFDDEDAAILCEGMVPGSAVAALAIEHTWAIDLANAIAAEGGAMGMNYRIPAPVVDEAFAALS
ncbi:MAG: hypothetical protein JSW55_10105 [Chloroflexota bacterium]|nr:MAG: hypothetical protein JSW55_10105 [Chloroflexota bacterium]